VHGTFNPRGNTGLGGAPVTLTTRRVDNADAPSSVTVCPPVEDAVAEAVHDVLQASTKIAPGIRHVAV
jgi:hypothetical protein